MDSLPGIVRRIQSSVFPVGYHSFDVWLIASNRQKVLLSICFTLIHLFVAMIIGFLCVAFFCSKVVYCNDYSPPDYRMLILVLKTHDVVFVQEANAVRMYWR